MDEITWQSLSTPAAVAAAVTFLLTVLKAALGVYWTSLVNGIAALVLSVGISLGITAAMGITGPMWASLVLAALNGIIVCGAVLGVTNIYKDRVVGDRLMAMEENSVAATKTKKKNK